MEIRSVAILGAGAIGCYMLWGLQDKKDLDLCVVAEGERKKRFEEKGFVINDVEYHPVVKTPEEAHGADFLIVSTKYDSLRGALEDIRTIADEHTIIMSLMNGVDSEEIIAEVVPMKQIVHSMIMVASERRGNSIRFDGPKSIGIVYGEQDTSVGRERVDAIAALFDNTGLNYRISDYIMSDIWAKFWLNIGNNQPQAIISVGAGAYTDSKYLDHIRVNLRKEVEAIAEAKGIDLEKAGPSVRKGNKVKPRARYSTLQDLDAKRHTEVEMFSGTVCRMGKALGIPTPYNEYTYYMIKTLEEKNDGLFDYE